MKKLPVLLLGVAVVCLAAYGGFWWFQANLAKRNVEQTLTRINAEALALGQEEPFLAYDGITLSGFPLHTTLTLTNPRSTLPIGAALALMKNRVPAAADAAPSGDWTEKVTYRGPVVISATLFKNRYSLEIHGGYESRSFVKGQESFRAKAVFPKPLHCEVQFAGTALGLSKRAVNADTTPEEWFNLFRELRCEFSEGLNIVDAANQELVISSDAYHMEIGADDPQDIKRDYRLKLDAPRIQYGPAYDRLVGKMEESSGVTLQGMIPIPKSALGNNAAHFDLRLMGPAEWQKGNVPPELTLDVQAFTVKNNLIDMQNRWLIEWKNPPESMEKSVVLKLDSQLRYSPAFDAAFKQHLPAGIEAMQKRPPQPPTPMSDWIASLSEQGKTVLLTQAPPQFSSLGLCRLHVDTRASLSLQQAAMQQKASLNDVAIGCEPYGITAKGSVTSPPPQMDITLALRHIPQLLADLIAYGQRIEPLLKDTPLMQYLNNQPLIEGVNVFIAAISQPDPANADIRVIQIQNGPDGMPTFSGKPLPEVMTLMQTHITSKLPQSKPIAKAK